MTVNYSKLGTRIAQYRLALGLSQQELAKHICISREYISRIETGKATISLETFVSLANELQATADDLLIDSLLHAQH